MGSVDSQHFAVFLAFTLSMLNALGAIESFDFSKWDGDSVLPFSGWTCSGISKSSVSGDYVGGVLFRAGGSSLVSPIFSGRLQKVSVSLLSAVPTPERRLRLIVVSTDGRSETALSFVPTDRKVYETQTMEVSQYNVNSFRIELGNGSSGNWYMMDIVVEYEGDDASMDSDDSSCIGYWRCSDFLPVPGFKYVDMSWLKEVTKAMEWQNGVTMDCFHAYADNGQPVSGIGQNRGVSRNYGLYATSTNLANGTVNVLSMLGSGSSGMSLLLPVMIDVPNGVRDVSVGFRSHQVSFRDKSVSTTNCFSWCTLNDLDNIGAAGVEWRSIPDGDYVTRYDGGLRPFEFLDASELKMISIPVAEVDLGRYLCFRWSVAGNANSSMMGISEVWMSATLRNRGTLVILR